MHTWRILADLLNIVYRTLTWARVRLRKNPMNLCACEELGHGEGAGAHATLLSDVLWSIGLAESAACACRIPKHNRKTETCVSEERDLHLLKQVTLARVFQPSLTDIRRNGNFRRAKISARLQHSRHCCGKRPYIGDATSCQWRSKVSDDL